MKHCLFFCIFTFLTAGISAAQDTDQELLDAVFRQEERKTFQLLKADADPNASTADGVTPLMYAADLGNLYLCKILIKKGAKVNAQPADGTSPLHAAVKNNHTEVLQYLLENGANPNIRDNNKSTPLHFACAYGYPRAADILLYFGADPDIRDQINRPMMITAFYGDTLMTDLLLQYGADVNLAGFFKDTPLILAAQENHLPVARMLCEAGAKLNSRNNSRLTALDMAAYKGHKKMVEYLLSIGAEPSNNIQEGISTGELALMQSYPEIEKILRKEKKGPSLSGQRYSVAFTQNTNFKDYLIGTEGTFHHNGINAEAFVGWHNRPFRKKVLIPQSENLSYQYREYRSGFYVGLHKNFAIQKYGYKQTGFFAGGTGALYLANYKGSTEKSHEFTALPQAGLYRYGRIAGVKAGYEYNPFNYANNHPHRIQISIRLFFNKPFDYTEKIMRY